MLLVDNLFYSYVTFSNELFAPLSTYFLQQAPVSDCFERGNKRLVKSFHRTLRKFSCFDVA
jgi:hypothetical protein